MLLLGSGLARGYGSTQQKKTPASTNGCLIAILVPVRDRTAIDDPIVGRALLLPDPGNAEDLKQLNCEARSTAAEHNCHLY